MRLLLIRHGETDWNKARRFQGQTDTSLNENGRHQAHIAAQQLAQEPISRILTSPLKRAWQTAEIIAAPHQLPIEKTPALQELYLGTWQGRTYEEVAAEYPAIHAVKTAPHGGETILDVAARLRPWLATLKRESLPNQSVAIITHGVIVQVCLCLCHGVGLNHYQQFVIDNATIQKLIL